MNSDDMRRQKLEMLRSQEGLVCQHCGTALITSEEIQKLLCDMCLRPVCQQCNKELSPGEHLKWIDGDPVYLCSKTCESEYIRQGYELGQWE